MIIIQKHNANSNCRRQIHAIVSEQKHIVPKEEERSTEIRVQSGILSHRKANWILDIEKHNDSWERTDMWLLLTLKHVLMTLPHIQHLTSFSNPAFGALWKRWQGLNTWINQSVPRFLLPGRTVLNNEGSARWWWQKCL